MVVFLVPCLLASLFSIQVLENFLNFLSGTLAYGLLLLCPILGLCFIGVWIRLAIWVAESGCPNYSDRTLKYVLVTVGAAASIVLFFAISMGIAFLSHS
jgi:hypothetical protein